MKRKIYIFLLASLSSLTSSTRTMSSDCTLEELTHFVRDTLPRVRSALIAEIEDLQKIVDHIESNQSMECPITILAGVKKYLDATRDVTILEKFNLTEQNMTLISGIRWYLQEDQKDLKHIDELILLAKNLPTKEQ